MPRPPSPALLRALGVGVFTAPFRRALTGVARAVVPTIISIPAAEIDNIEEICVWIKATEVTRVYIGAPIGQAGRLTTFHELARKFGINVHYARTNDEEMLRRVSSRENFGLKIAVVCQPPLHEKLAQQFDVRVLKTRPPKPF